MAVAGEALKIEDVEEILETVLVRQKNFPQEPREIAFLMVMLNIGERYRSVTCSEGEWVGQKKDINNRGEGGIPLCPDGHPLFQAENVLRLGWVNST